MGVSQIVVSEPQTTAGEAVVAVIGVRAGAAAEDLLGQRGQVAEAGPGLGGIQQDLVGAALVLIRQPVCPVQDLPGNGRRDATRGKSGRDTRVCLQAPHPLSGGAGCSAGAARLPPQPGPDGDLPVGGVTAGRAERSQDPGHRRQMNRLTGSKPAYAVGLLGRRQRRRVGRGQERSRPERTAASASAAVAGARPTHMCGHLPARSSTRTYARFYRPALTFLGGKQVAGGGQPRNLPAPARTGKDPRRDRQEPGAAAPDGTYGQLAWRHASASAA